MIGLGGWVRGITTTMAFGSGSVFSNNKSQWQVQEILEFGLAEFHVVGVALVECLRPALARRLIVLSSVGARKM
jgi:hypothetical protein